MLALACGLLALPAWTDEPPAAAKPGTAQPNVHVLPTPFLIPGLNRERTVRIYLPPGYEQGTRRYPVLYMHDGQNLFDDATAYAGEWGIDETLNELAKSRGLELIVVGIDNGGAERIHELNAWDNPQFGKGEGEQYTAFIVEVLKPWIDQHYRTRPDRRHTAIMGSSMGGLISSYAISRYPQVFGKAGIFSPAYWPCAPGLRRHRGAAAAAGAADLLLCGRQRGLKRGAGHGADGRPAAAPGAARHEPGGARESGRAA